MALLSFFGKVAKGIHNIFTFFKGIKNITSGGLGSLLKNTAEMQVASKIRQKENEHLAGKEVEQNEFNAEQAALQRDFAHQERLETQDFNASQAQAQMDFQERMSNTQYQRQVADMQAAGVNPALAIGGITGASASGAMATSSPASGAAASGSSQLQGLSDLMQFVALEAEIDKTKAEAGKIRSETEGQDIQNSISSEYGKLTAEANLNHVNQAIAESIEHIELSKSQRSVLIPAQAALAKAQQESLDAERLYTEWRNEYYKFNDRWPEQKAEAEFVSLLRWFADKLFDKAEGAYRQVSGKILAKQLDEALKRGDIIDVTTLP